MGRGRENRSTGAARQSLRIAVVVGGSIGLGACSGIASAPDAPNVSGLGCVDDSRQCIDQRATALRTLLADSNRKWVREPAAADAYASGVRMYAFKQKKRDLSCDELSVGRREADAAPTVLRGPGGQSLTPAQVSRGVMFSADVGKELTNEHRRRCKA